MKNIKEVSTIGIVNLGAPEPLMFKENFERGLNFLKKQGYDLKLASNMMSKNRFTAGSSNEQAKSLMDFIEDSSIDMIMCVGGGANANCMLPHLNPCVFEKNQKILVGMSIVSGIWNYLSYKTGILTFHGPTLIWSFGDKNGIPEYTLNCMNNILNFPSSYNYSKRDLAADWEILKKGTASGKLFGGNLWTMQQLLGTPYEPDWKNCILFLEECFTELHNIEAMLYHFKNAGVLNKISGLIIGDCLECQEEEYEEAHLNKIVLDVCKDLELPILSCVELGHTAEKITLPIGSKALLNLENQKNPIFQISI